MAKQKSNSSKTKKEKFEEARRAARRKYSIIGGVLVVVVVALVVALVLSTRTPAVGGTVVEKGGADYYSGTVAMSLLETVTVNEDSVELSVAEITAKKIGGVLYSRDTPLPAGYDNIPDNGLPILAYVAPSGRLVVASSLCEPCRSYQFHIEGDYLVCNACFTRWELNTLKGIDGGCQAYPPEELEATVEGDKVIIQKDVLESWTPRI